MEKYTESAVTLAKEAGSIIRRDFNLGIKKQWKADDTAITATDHAVNSLVLERLRHDFPDHSIITEEAPIHLENSAYTWVCDPLDGSLPFAHHLPISVFALALLHQGKVILSVAYDPYRDYLYSAVKGQGARLNGDQIRVSSHQNLSQAFVDVEWAPTAPYNLSLLPAALGASDAKTTMLCSTIYAGTNVASGEMTAMASSVHQPWDAAALKILVEEAGGTVTDLYGQDQAYDRQVKGVVVSNGHVHPQLLKLIKQSL